jgi:hypothetical protein
MEIVQQNRGIEQTTHMFEKTLGNIFDAKNRARVKSTETSCMHAPEERPQSNRDTGM